MFRLNGDICRQLSKKYKITFKQKYKKEIKERVMLYINHIINSNQELNILERLEFFKNTIIIEKNKVTSIHEDLLTRELFDFFNPDWYIEKEKLAYTKKEEENMYEDFKYEICQKVKEKYEKIINPNLINNFDLEIHYIKESVEKINNLFENRIIKKESIDKKVIKNILIKKNELRNIKNNLKELKENNLIFSYKKEFKNIKIYMNTEKAFYIKEDKSEYIFKENSELKIDNKTLVLLNSSTRYQAELFDSSILLGVGYQHIINYILLYINELVVIEIEKYLEEN